MKINRFRFFLLKQFHRFSTRRERFDWFYGFMFFIFTFLCKIFIKHEGEEVITSETMVEAVKEGEK
jgi:hypothetical protein